MDFKYQSNNKNGEIDTILFITIFILAGIGIAMIYSASAVYALNTFGDSFYFFKRQVAWVCIGFAALFIFQNIDYHIYTKYTKIMLLVSFLLLVLLLIPGIGHGTKGSVRWFRIGEITIQPSEFVKVFMVLYLVKVFASGSGEKINRILQLLIPMIVVFAIFLLIMLQPDFGTAIDLLLVFGVILFVFGFPFFSILYLSLISVPMFYLLIYQVQYRKERILAYLDPWKERFGAGYHIIQSYIAFKKGGLLGTGLGFGTQKIKRLPEPHTDFIFAVIAEESGYLGTALILILYCVLFWRGMIISLSARDEFGSLLAIGLTILITVQAFMNIGVVCGILPTKGIPLPLVSYGGSSFLSCMIALGILLNISKQTDQLQSTFRLRDGEFING
ncbi:MAG: putative lipid II flippase FtsW [Spirochaetes bacterium]|nr:putative lipid II flippase FtsW [Spirochaetota bacterium]